MLLLLPRQLPKHYLHTRERRVFCKQLRWSNIAPIDRLIRVNATRAGAYRSAPCECFRKRCNAPAFSRLPLRCWLRSKNELHEDATSHEHADARLFECERFIADSKVRANVAQYVLSLSACRLVSLALQSKCALAISRPILCPRLVFAFLSFFLSQIRND